MPATRIWTAGGGLQAMENSANYDDGLGGPLLTDDNLWFREEGSSDAARATASLSVGSATVDPDFNSNWNTNDNDITFNNDISATLSGYSVYADTPGYLFEFGNGAGNVVTFNGANTLVKIVNAGTFRGDCQYIFSAASAAIDFAGHSFNTDGITLLDNTFLTVSGSGTIELQNTYNLMMGDNCRFNYDGTGEIIIKSNSNSKLVTAGNNCYIGGKGTLVTFLANRGGNTFLFDGFTFDGSCKLRYSDGGNSTPCDLEILGDINTIYNPFWLEGRCDLVSNGNSFGNLFINAGSSDIIRPTETLYCQLVTVKSGTFNRNGQAVIAWKDSITPLSKTLGDPTWL